MKKSIFLIGCSSLKAPGIGVPDSIYKGSLYSISRLYTKKMKVDFVYVLSGKLFLLNMAQKICSYNYTLRGKPVDIRKQWSQKVYTLLVQRHNLNNVEITILAGKVYWEYLAPLLPNNPNLPLANKRIGEQLKWLNSQL
jgi:hypothetical protein